MEEFYIISSLVQITYLDEIKRLLGEKVLFEIEYFRISILIRTHPTTT